jgi:hypothetical protein
MTTTHRAKPRPPGLTVLAVFNLFNFAAAGVYLAALFFGAFQERPGWATTLLGSLSGLLALISAVGFLRRHYLLGYGVGNGFGIFLLVYAVGFLAGNGSVNPMEYFAWLSYPVILLLALNLLYRREFERPVRPDVTASPGTPE